MLEARTREEGFTKTARPGEGYFPKPAIKKKRTSSCRTALPWSRGSALPSPLAAGPSGLDIAGCFLHQLILSGVYMRGTLVTCTPTYS